MVYIGRHPGKGVNETIYLYRKRLGQIYLPHDFFLDLLEIVRRRLLKKREIISLLIFLILFPFLYLAFLIFTPLVYLSMIFWLGEYVYIKLYGGCFSYTIFEGGLFLRLVSMLGYGLVYRGSKMGFSNRGVVLYRLMFSKIMGISQFFFSMCSEFYWGL